MVTIDFFDGIQKFRTLAPGVDASRKFDGMESSANIAKKKLKDLIEDMWDDLKAYHESKAADKPKWNEAVGYLQGAFANLVMYEFAPFWFQEQKEEGKDYYRYEQQNQREAYISNLWIYMDSLLDLFNNNEAEFLKWKETQTYKDRENLLIESADEFDRYYDIGRSHYFFSKIIFIIREIGEDHIYSMIKTKERLSEAGNEKLKVAVKKAVVFYTMGHAVKRLDFTELPKSIRNNDRDTSRTMRTGYSESQAIEKLSESLLAKYDEYMNDVDFELNKPAPGTSAFLGTDINNEDDKSYYMS